ncbi:MAG: hypothetical protein E7231_12755 [Cellulosilyticum sp.]|nr:hypothetical protein [Cellulosilyticum sp.]
MKMGKLYKGLLVAFSTVLMSASVMATVGTGKRVDNISIEFKEDTAILGSWQSVDFVEKMEDFDVNKPQWKQEDLYLAQLTFTEGGKTSMVIRENNTLLAAGCVFTWTDGVIIDPVDETASQYEIKTINGEEYMFMEWKSGDYTSGKIENPYYYVLKKGDTPLVGLAEGVVNDATTNTADERHDDINIPFEDNGEIQGEWKSVSYVEQIEDFGNVEFEGDLFVDELNILPNGAVEWTCEGKRAENALTWTGTKLINTADEVVMNCTIKELDGKTYMFMEWKSGDYVYRGMEPWYCVFEKQN